MPKLKTKCFNLARKSLANEPTEDGYIEVLRQVLGLVQPSYLIVDALDECREQDSDALKGYESKEHDLTTLQEWLITIAGFDVKIIITARLVKHIENLVDNKHHFRLDLSDVVDNLDADIEKFIYHRINRKNSGFPSHMPRVVKELKIRSSVSGIHNVYKCFLSRLRNLPLYSHISTVDGPISVLLTASTTPGYDFICPSHVGHT